MVPAQKNPDIIRLIKDDHKSLKAGIKILTSDKPAEEKQAALLTFLYDLELHAKTEEKSLYDKTIDDDELRDEVLEAYEEHALADLLSLQLKDSGFEDEWTDFISAKAKVLAKLVKHHIDEEEEEMLPDLRDAYDREELIALGEIYLQFRKEVQEMMEQEADEESLRSLAGQSGPAPHLHS